MSRTRRIRTFIGVGTLSTLLDLATMALLVEGAGLSSAVMRNGANAIAMEVGTLCAFVLNRSWTWKNVPHRRGTALLRQFLAYHLCLFFGIGIRLAVFAVLDAGQVPYLFSVALAILAAAAVNFLYFEYVVFREAAPYQP